MASDSDGRNSAAILRSIREKLVEYKESLLRQLVDEREEALAASNEQDGQEDGDNSVTEQEAAPTGDRRQEQAHTQVEVEAPNPADYSGVAAVESPAESAATTDEPVEKVPSAQTTAVEIILKKRRLEVESAAVQAEKDGVPVKRAKRSRAKSQEQPLESAESSKHRDAKDEKLTRALESTEEMEDLPQGAPYRVVRTPMPPNKYLMQKRREEEASDRRQQQPELLTSSVSEVTGHGASNGVTGVKRPAALPRRSSVSVDSTNTEFERRLRETVRLHREVKKRSVNVTRKRQLPRLPTPARGKSHWDFLLEEMKWMATDFSQERNWKRVMQYRLAADVIVAQNAESVRQEQENRQMARGVALQVSAFWRTMERIAARSRVRFEAAGSEPSSRGESDDAMAGDLANGEEDSKRDKTEESSIADDGALMLKYQTIDITASAEVESKSDGKGRRKADAVLASAKSQMTYIVSAVERASVADVMQLYGKSSSVRASLWKASSQQEDTSQYMNALLLALSCLSLRRVRSEVEPELGKIEEISLSCQPSFSQKTQYRNALSGFAATLDTAGGREERLSVWLQLLLRLREICNCVDIVNDLDKLGHADLRILTSSSAKLEALEPLLRRLAIQEGKKVVIYCQFTAMFPILELFLSLLDIGFVRVTGSIAMQRRALCHFADRPVVRVALVSTRLSTLNGRRAASVFGGEVIVVVDGDWNAACDAKLRASWAKMAVGGADTLPVYRLHCENTVEASLLRVGASLTEKVFGEMTPQELLAVPSDLASSLTIEKPSWWSSTATSSGGNGLTGSGTTAQLAIVAQQVEKDAKYCGDTSELEMPLIVHNVDLDAEEHLLLANTDELTPVEWYAVNYVHGVTDNKQQQGGGKAVERGIESTEDEGNASWNEKNAYFHSDQRSFEMLAAAETNRQWQNGDAAAQLFYNLESRHSGGLEENALEKLFMQMRMEGMETHFDVYKPPQPPSAEDSSLQPMAHLSSEAGTSTDNQMTFKVSYRVPAPLPLLPQPGKSKLDHGVGQHGDPAKLAKSSKKQRANAAAMAAARGVMSGLMPGSSSAGAASAGVKRKLESQLAGIKSGSQKEQRVDLEGIPVPDISEFADDDFWGDTNLDALDSAEWDDPALLGGILGVGVGGTGTSSAASSSGTASTGAGTSTAIGADGAGSAGVHKEAGHSKTGSQKSSKKSKTGTGRARKSSMSADSGRDAWSVHDDIVLKKLFELYGANWTLIAQVFNSATAVSRFVCKKRSPRQCYDRYGKIISGILGSSTTGTAAAAKDAKSSALKAQRAAAAASVAAAQLTPTVLDARIGLPQSELLLQFPQRHSLPGLPPPSIVSVPSLVEMTLAHRKKQATADAAASKKSTATHGGGLDDLKSIKTSFDAIIQCMKHKTSPPPIPIPVGSSTTATSTAATATSSSTDLGTKASLTAASFPAPQAPVPAPVTTTPTKTTAKKATVSPVAAAKAMPVVVPPPHKSHTDMISLLPAAALGPDEVIKRSKEAAVVAVQAAAAVASVGRDGSPLSASGDVMLGAGSGFGATVSSSMSRRSHAASLTSEISVMAASAVSTAAGAAAGAPSSGAPQQTSPVATTAAWGGNLASGVSANGLDAGVPLDLSGAASGSESQRNAPMPVTTSTLLHVLDRMPEIKNKIQSILNRTDCSESQKVAMIARLLSNTNAINNTNALGGSASMASAADPGATTSAVLSALTVDPGMLSSSDMLIDTETPIPMPASLATPSPPNVATSSQRPFQPPASSQP
ncbi:hypothetical protein PRIC2_011781 [Phytophthora ramorum]